MVNWISGITGILWGGGLIAARVIETIPEGQSFYSTGRIVGLLLGLFLFLYGIIFIKRAFRQRKIFNGEEP